ncbi:MAG: YihY/virulence factor BrkB family protein [Verrucomicrobiota bacterium JB022]|nr:YihY/virulence factor BrkB family protein [Verrucomicrobiota bacterium JB022]
MKSLHNNIARVQNYWQHEIWASSPAAAQEQDVNWRVKASRLVAITIHGVLQNGILTRAAALAYSTLLALGPLIVIVVLISSSFWPSNAEGQIKKLMIFLAPSLGEYIRLEQTPDTTAAAADGVAAATQQTASELDGLISEIITGAQDTLGGINTSGSGIFGIIGLAVLIWIVIQLLTTIENTLNDIWGVKKGREWGYRIVFYWAFISLGTILGLGTGAFISASFLGGFFDWLPDFGPLTRIATLIPSLAILTMLLTFFYLFFPNTQVNIRPALLGGAIAATLLIANNFISTIYVGQVIRIQNLYGSVAIVPVLMIGLYFSWLLVLVGGQISYAAQNVHFLADQSAWDRSSQLVRQSLTMGALLYICRRFHRGEPPTGLEQLSEHLRAPRNMLNESINRLVQLNLVTKVPDENPDVQEEFRYQPARPLRFMRLAQVHQSLEQLGNNGGLDLVSKVDPLLAQYLKQRDETLGYAEPTIEDLFESELQRESVGPSRSPEADPSRA